MKHLFGPLLNITFHFNAAQLQSQTYNNNIKALFYQ